MIKTRLKYSGIEWCRLCVTTQTHEYRRFEEADKSLWVILYVLGTEVWPRSEPWVPPPVNTVDQHPRHEASVCTVCSLCVKNKALKKIYGTCCSTEFSEMRTRSLFSSRYEFPATTHRWLQHRKTIVNYHTLILLLTIRFHYPSKLTIEFKFKAKVPNKILGEI